MQSKKFVAYLVAEGTWKVALLVVLIMGMNNGTINHIVGGLALAIVIIAGAVEITYVSGQAALDKYIRIASIVVGAGQNFSMKGVASGHPQENAGASADRSDRSDVRDSDSSPKGPASG